MFWHDIWRLKIIKIAQYQIITNYRVNLSIIVELLEPYPKQNQNLLMKWHLAMDDP